MEKEFINKLYKAHQDCPNCPSPVSVAKFYEALLGTLFPDFSSHSFNSPHNFELHIEGLKRELGQLLRNNPNRSLQPDTVVKTFFETLPLIHERLEHDIDAMFEGDPAAKSKREIIRTYPGFYAIAAYRVANALHVMGAYDIPRIITEHAHSKTGVDIHPGATIGEYFCIDHGTGIVIGETTLIGNRVKIYQGVTLGALSVNKEDASKKRHPTIEDNVVIYAGVTVLGGNTVIGNGSVIGGNVWLTRSVAPNSKIYYQAKMFNDDTNETDVLVFKS